MQTKDKKAVIFDFDGTIADTLPLVLDSVSSIFPHLHIKLLTELEIEALKELSALQLLEKFKISKFHFFFSILKVQRYMRHHIQEILLMPQMNGVFSKLKAEGYDLIIASSNAKDNIAHFNATNKITEFSNIYTSLSVFGKQHLFNRILKREKLRPQNVVYICDEVRDIEACKKIGIRSIAVSWGYNNEKALLGARPDALVHDSKELLASIKNYL